MYSTRFRLFIVAAAVGLLSGGGRTVAEDTSAFEQAKQAFEARKWETAVPALQQEVKANPGNQMAYILLGQALEAKGDKAEAVKQWEALLTIATDEEVRRVARKGYLRCRAHDLETMEWQDRDPFHVPDVDIDYRGLDQVDDATYLQLPGMPWGTPPVELETKHFFIATCSEKLTTVAGKICEKYLAFMRERLFDGRAWSQKVPILIYKDMQDYIQVGKNPEGSGGVTKAGFGMTAAVALFQLSDEAGMKFQKVDNPVKGNLEDTLPHELMHMVLFEFFGAQANPLWLHEGCARQMEQVRKDLKESADMARDTVSGEFIRLRDLFNSEGYPTGGENLRFYDQSAAVVTFIALHGPEAFRAFLDEVRLQHGWDAAAAAALGIPEDGAIEELERRWVEWMKERYVKDLDLDEPGDCIDCTTCDECRECTDCDSADCVRCVPQNTPDSEIANLPCKPKCWPVMTASSSNVFLPGIDLIKTLAPIGTWVKIPTDSMQQFRPVEESGRFWTADGGRIVCNTPDGTPNPVLLAVKTYEEQPVVIRCKVRYTGAQPQTYFGFTQLNLAGDDLGVQALAPLQNGAQHELMCLLASDLSLYVDGRCVGRYPAALPSPEDDDNDYPVALVAQAPVQVWDVEAVTLHEKDIVLRSDEPGSTEDGAPPPPGPTSPPGPGRGGRATDF